MVLEMMIVVTMLIYTVSLDLQLPVCITIHNQCSNIELVKLVYFSNGAVCPQLSSQQIDIDTKTRASFEIDATQDEFEGALLYKLQRYSNSKYNMDTLNIEANKNETKCVQMLVAWKVTDSESFVYVVLVEHVKEFTWNEDELKKLYYENQHLLKESNGAISDTWFVENNVILKTTFKVRGLKGNFELSVSISEEEERYNYAMRPLCVDLER
jgi:leucyl aminopeptidase (aminopeptidase T)